MAYLKPQSPLQKGDDYIYPLTTTDQIITEDGERLSAKAVYLDSSGSEDGVAESVNADMLGGKFPGYYTCPYNLLDNSDFTNPVNQRGITSVSGQGGTYTMDRWFIGDIWTSGACKFSQNNGSITFHQGLFQRMSAPKSRFAGKIFTLALRLVDGTTCVMPIALPVDLGDGVTYSLLDNGVTGCLRYFDATNCMEVRFECGHDAACLWAALYEGNYTAETLPPYRPKGYAVELTECQRYYCRFDSNNDPCWMIAVNGNFAVGAINFPMKMRAVPDLTNIQCIDLSSNPASITGAVCSEKGVSYIEGPFTVGAGYRVLFEASADL